MSTPEKRTGFLQGLYQVSTTKKEEVGAVRRLRDGRTFRYAKASAALVAGKMCVATLADAGWLHQACPAAAAGSTRLVLTVTAGGTLAEGQLENGLFIVAKGATADSAPEGYQYEIAWNSALAATDTSLVIVLKEPLVQALTTSDYFRIQPNLWAAVTQANGASSAGIASQVPVGVPLVNVPSGSYCWLLTKGLGAGRLKPRKAMTVMTVYPGQRLMLSVSGGYLTPGSMTTVYPRNLCVGKFAGPLTSSSAYIRNALPVIFDVEW